MSLLDRLAAANAAATERRLDRASERINNAHARGKTTHAEYADAHDRLCLDLEDFEARYPDRARRQR